GAGRFFSDGGTTRGSSGGQIGAKGGVVVAQPTTSEHTARDSNRRDIRRRPVYGRDMGDSLLELPLRIGQLLLRLLHELFGLIGASDLLP
ncbi:hypothetical protein, partial [Pseudomonas aeruginosa]|uniref:hypothetical protein n=1 Tax=Pseudomonas aeruginosa TaxID=287 RepID=UPI00195546F4